MDDKSSDSEEILNEEFDKMGKKRFNINILNIPKIS